MSVGRLVMERILVVGSGITGAATAALLRQQLPSSCQLTVWEKASWAGGRMSTSCSQVTPGSTVDLGAQYISISPTEYLQLKKLYDELDQAGVLSPLHQVVEGSRHEEGTRHFVTPNGTSSLVKHFLRKSNCDVKYSQLVQQIDLVEGCAQWSVMSGEAEVSQFDCVVLTMPVPQILQLQGSIKQIIDRQTDVKKQLSAVTYSCRFAMGLFYKAGVDIDIPWAAKYFYDDPSIRFVSIDNKKRQAGSECGTSVCVHTSVPFSLQHLEEDEEAVCSDLVMPALHTLLPQLPVPSEVKPHKWRYSQVHQAYAGCPGAITLHSSPLLVCAGDGFISSGFNNCMRSANNVVDIVKSHHSTL